MYLLARVFVVRPHLNLGSVIPGIVVVFLTPAHCLVHSRCSTNICGMS